MEFVRSINQESPIFLPNQQFVGLGLFDGARNHVYGPPFGLLNPNSGPYIVGTVVYTLSPALLDRMEIERSISLFQFMEDEGLVPSQKEEIKRRNVIGKLKEIVIEWAKRTAYQRQLPKSHIRAASAIILPYGSYGLGVHSDESDIDALCVGPCFVTMAEDFFIVLRNMLASKPEVSEIHSVKDAKVPLIRFKFDGVSIDLPYAKINAISVPENADVLNSLFLTNIDEISWRSLSGVRANKIILQLVPNIELYQSLLRYVKFWARRRGVYCSIVGFFGGIHLAVLAALICRRLPNAHLSSLVSIFFQTFAFWPWPTPVLLVDETMPTNYLPIERSLMPIQLPGSPNEYCYSNITRSTFNRIRVEFLRGHAVTKDILSPDFNRKSLFEPFSYVKNYGKFLKICLSTSHQDELGDWVGWVKSRFRCLLIKLEELLGFCDPNPTEYTDIELPVPNMVFFWGLKPAMSHNIDADAIKEDFIKNLVAGHEGPIGQMELSVVKASELPNTNTNTGSKGNKACWRVADSNERKIPVYSKHMPQYFVGYLADNGNA